MEIQAIPLKVLENSNIILGQTHFIKTIEDLYEILKTTVPQGKFGIAFSEASGPCLIRWDGNDKELIDTAVENLKNLSCGHTFCILIKDCYPINVLNAIKNCQEVCSIFCATANPVKAIVARDGKNGGILGVIDGEGPKGVEGEEDQKNRKEFLRKIGYKR
jgi:adenosine/AMP kinase